MMAKVCPLGEFLRNRLPPDVLTAWWNVERGLAPADVLGMTFATEEVKARLELTNPSGLVGEPFFPPPSRRQIFFFSLLPSLLFLSIGALPPHFFFFLLHPPRHLPSLHAADLFISVVADYRCLPPPLLLYVLPHLVTTLAEFQCRRSLSPSAAVCFPVPCSPSTPSTSSVSASLLSLVDEHAAFLSFTVHDLRLPFPFSLSSVAAMAGSWAFTSQALPSTVSRHDLLFISLTAPSTEPPPPLAAAFILSLFFSALSPSPSTTIAAVIPMPSPCLPAPSPPDILPPASVAKHYQPHRRLLPLSFAATPAPYHPHDMPSLSSSVMLYFLPGGWQSQVESAPW